MKKWQKWLTPVITLIAVAAIAFSAVFGTQKADLQKKTDELDDAIIKIHDAEDIIEESEMVRDTLLPIMSELRVPCDKAELLTAKSYWPFPTYEDLLFGVK